MNILMIIFVCGAIFWLLTFGYAYTNSNVPAKKKKVLCSKWLCLASALVITASLVWASVASIVLWDDFTETEYRITYVTERDSHVKIVHQDANGEYFVKANDDWNILEPERKIYLEKEFLIEYLTMSNKMKTFILQGE